MARWLMGCLALAAVAAAPPARSPLLPGVVMRGQKNEEVRAVALSDDGKRLVACWLEKSEKGAESWTIRNYDLAAGREWKRVSLNWSVGSVAFSPDSKSLALSSVEGLHVFDERKLTEVLKVDVPNRGIYHRVRFSTKGTALGSIDYKGASRLEVTNAKMDHASRLDVYAVGAVFSSDLALLAVPEEQDVDLWDPVKGEIVRTLGEHRGVVKAVAFSSDGKRLAVAASRLTWERRYLAELRLWEVGTGKLLRTIDLGECYPRSLAFSGDGKWLVFVGRRGTEGPGRLSLFDADGVERAARSFSQKETLLDVTSAAGGTRFATTHADGSIRLWDVRSGR